MEKIKEKQIIYYANIIARLKTKFSIEEEKALHLIFKQINAFGKNDLTIKLNKSHFFDKLELKSSNRYNRYRNLIRGLIQKTYVELMDEKGKEILGVVINASSWNSKEPFFEVDLTPRFMPFIEQLVRDYTKVDLYSILGFKSKHSLTLYKFLCSWSDENKKINQRYITTKDLKELLGLSKESYMQGNKFNRASFERETIKKAINEINEISNINVFFKKNKKRNKVQNYEFNWTQKEKPIVESSINKNSNKRQSLNDKQTQMLPDNIDGH